MTGGVRFMGFGVRVFRGVALLLSVLAGGGPVRGDDPASAGAGALYLRDGEGGWRAAPLLASDVEIRVTGLVARARVNQRFTNPTDGWLEGVYVFPLPELAAVDHLQLRAGERVIEGRVREREKARQVYVEARDSGRQAALLDQRRPNLFRMSITNLAPGETVEVRLEYQDTVRYAGGRFRLRFPLVAPVRHWPEPAATQPGKGRSQAARLPIRDRGEPRLRDPQPEDGPVGFTRLLVELEAGLPLQSLASPTHTITSRKLPGDRHRVEFAGEADRDFVLEWRVTPSDQPRAAIFSETQGREIYALLLLVPPELASPGSRLAREVVFVIDVSGSMSGPAIQQARRALSLALERLREDDAFNVIAFSDGSRSLFPQSERVDANSLQRARRWVEALQAEGGTEMRGAMERALTGDSGFGDLRQVVFITDGAIANEEELFAVIAAKLGRSRLFPVGIGSAPNDFFLRRAAKFGRGFATGIAAPGEVDARMRELFLKLETPALTDLEVYWNDEVEMWPGRPPDLYAGEPLMLAVRLPRFAGEVVVSGVRAGRRWATRLALAPDQPARGLGVLWARRKIAALMESRIRGAAPEGVERAVVEVALAHHLVSRYTSLVAVERNPRRGAHEVLRRGAVAPNPPATRLAAQVGVLPRTATAGQLWCWGGALLLLCAWTLHALNLGGRRPHAARSDSGGWRV